MSNKIKPRICKCCYGKGYSTEWLGDLIAMPDFIGDKKYLVRKGNIIIHLCSCGRGKDLAKYFTIKRKYK
jgi:hypothetical protein